MDFEMCRAIPADHPSLAGHFPDEPIVPGLVLLDEVAGALAKWRGSCQLVGIPTVKFLRPLKPKEPFNICLSGGKEAETEVEFCCRAEGHVIVKGRLEIKCGPV